MHQVVEELRSLIERDPELSKQAEQMFEQQEADEQNSSNDLVKREIQDQTALLEALDRLLIRAPEYKAEDLGLVGLPFCSIINWPLGTGSGNQLFTDPSVNDQLRKILEEWTKFLSSRNSSYVLNDSSSGWLCGSALDFMMNTSEGHGSGEFRKVFISNPSEEHWGFRSFDDFFTRKLRDGARPIASPTDWNIITHPCEASPFRVDTNVQACDSFWIKGQSYSLELLLAGHPLTSSFIGGTIYQGFLKAGGYHRWHCPVDGIIKNIHHQAGTYFSKPQIKHYDPSDPIEWQPYIIHVATRILIFIEADNPDIGLMCLMPVGWAEVSSVEITAITGQRMRKGEQLGMFHFGGSTHCLIFQSGVVLDFDLQGQTPGREAEVVPVNSKIATVIKRYNDRVHCCFESWT